ncbi:MAG: hypothetical protein HY921_11640 [Elusimicrobia bacterium]|nr:hypothetical protein [Elusimicrobiota bacterium]
MILSAALGLAFRAEALLPNKINSDPPHTSERAVEKAVEANQDLKNFVKTLDLSCASEALIKALYDILDEFAQTTHQAQEAFLAVQETREDVIHGADPDSVLETVWGGLGLVKPKGGHYIWIEPHVPEIRNLRERLLFSNLALAHLATKVAFNNMERAQIETLKEIRTLALEFKAKGWQESRRLPDFAPYEENLEAGLRNWAELDREMEALKPGAPAAFLEGLERLSGAAIYRLLPVPQDEGAGGSY